MRLYLKKIAGLLLLAQSCLAFSSQQSSWSPSLFSDVGFLGRNLDLHVEMFPNDLKNERSFFANKDVLFVPAGPTSVKGELVNGYGLDPQRIQLCDLAYPESGLVEDNAKYLKNLIFDAEERFALLYGAGRLINWNLVDGLAKVIGIDDLRGRRVNYSNYMNILKKNNQDFLNDYLAHPDWMSRCDISALPQKIKARKYDLILSGNLLHLYSHVLDDETHYKAYRELTNVLAPGGKLLVFPITTIMGKDHKILGSIIEQLELDGFKVELVRSESPRTNEYYKKLLKMPYQTAFYMRVTAPN